MDKDYFLLKLYPLQEKVLRIINSLSTGFYLTGGTASSRAYLHHRFSDDLDFFVNDDRDFHLWSDRILTALTASWNIEVLSKEDRFVRLLLQENEIIAKIEFVNDVPSHIGALLKHETLGLLDSPENILANKITAAVDRQEPKDLADIWGFCTKMNLSLEQAITNAHSKAAGIFPADLARILCTASVDDWKVIRWIDAPDLNVFVDDLRRLGEKLILP